jgi:hypothetical protein
VGSEDPNTFLADQWISYIRINAGCGDAASVSSQPSEWHKILDEFAAAPASREEAEKLPK